MTLALVPPARALAKTLRSRKTGFGLCPGTTQQGFEEHGLTDWLHTHIQACAGRPRTTPLTFTDLKDEHDDSRSISLQLMTTDVSAGRPVRLPLPDDNEFYFDPDEIEKLIPAAVVTWMREQAKEKTMKVGGKTVYPVPGAGMPVLLATRMSLAVPGLIASVPFYERRRRLAARVRRALVQRRRDHEQLPGALLRRAAPRPPDLRARPHGRAGSGPRRR